MELKEKELIRKDEEYIEDNKLLESMVKRKVGLDAVWKEIIL